MKHHPRCIIVFALNSIFIVIFIILLSCSMDVLGFRPLKYQPPPSKSMNKSFTAEAYSGPSYGGIGHKWFKESKSFCIFFFFFQISLSLNGNFHQLLFSLFLLFIFQHLLLLLLFFFFFFFAAEKDDIVVVGAELHSWYYK